MLLQPLQRNPRIVPNITSVATKSMPDIHAQPKTLSVTNARRKVIGREYAEEKGWPVLQVYTPIFQVWHV